MVSDFQAGWACAALGHRSPGLDPEPREPDHLERQMVVRPGTRQRSSVLLTGMPSQHLALDAEDAHFPMASGTGPSIAEPDAALRAAMDYYAHQLSGLPQTQVLLDTKDGSVADSEAAINEQAIRVHRS